MCEYCGVQQCPAPPILRRLVADDITVTKYIRRLALQSRASARPPTFARAHTWLLLACTCLRAWRSPKQHGAAAMQHGGVAVVAMQHGAAWSCALGCNGMHR